MRSPPDRYFPPESKAQARELVDQLFVALKERIGALQWMTPATKAKALAKADMINVKIGYPDRWCRDYRKLQVLRAPPTPRPLAWVVL